MKAVRIISILVVASLAIPPVAFAQQAVGRDPQAFLLAAKSVAAMGGSVPSSSVATGTVQVVEGSLEDSGTVRVLTRGLEETREEFALSGGFRGSVYSHDLAAELEGTNKEEASLELAASSQSPCFPLVILASALNNPDFSFEYIGEEKLDDGSLTYHIRFRNTFATQPKRQPLAEFSVKDLWVDAVSGLPRKLAYEQREARGDAPSIAVGAIYSDWRNVGGILYPFLIERIFNGTPWATIRITDVTLNTSVSDAEFAIK